MAPPVLPDSVPICSLTGPKTSVSCLDCGFQTNLSRRPLHIWTWLCRLDCFAWSSSSTLRPFEPLLYTVARVIVIKCQLCPFTAPSPPSGSPTAATVPLVLLGEPSGGRPAAPELSRLSQSPLLSSSSTHPCSLPPPFARAASLPRTPFLSLSSVCWLASAESTALASAPAPPSLALPREVGSSRRAGPVPPLREAASRGVVAARLTLVRHEDGDLSRFVLYCDCAPRSPATRYVFRNFYSNEEKNGRTSFDVNKGKAQRGHPEILAAVCWAAQKAGLWRADLFQDGGKYAVWGLLNSLGPGAQCHCPRTFGRGSSISIC